MLGTPDYDHERHGQIGRIEHFLHVCDAISYSHSRGVVHRDLKPDNLMLGAYGEVYVMDWGIARLIDEPEEESSVANIEVYLDSANSTADGDEMKTQVGVMMGTPLYMPPEQMTGKGVGPKSDQFALGMVLFEMLTFSEPREIKNRSELVEKVSAGSRDSFSDVEQLSLIHI